MNIRDKLKERLNVSPISFYVKEWDETVYCTPLSCGDMTQIQKRHPDFLSNLTGEAMVDLIIRKLTNADGEKLFDVADKGYLLGESMVVISSVAANIIGAQASEDYEKN
jgi:hypothetical protein